MSLTLLLFLQYCTRPGSPCLPLLLRRILLHLGDVHPPFYCGITYTLDKWNHEWPLH